MGQASGANAKIVYDVETVFGSNPGAPDVKVLPFVSETFGEKRSLHRTNVMRGSRNLTKPVRGNRDPSGGINCELNPFMGTMLKHLLGTCSSSAGPPYTHTIKVGALPVSLVIEKQFLDLATPQYFLYNGVRINKASFEFNPDGFIAFNLDVLAQKETVGAAPLDATATDLGHLPFEGFECSLTEGGVAFAIANKVAFDVSNDLDGGNYVIAGAGLRRALPEGKCAVTGVLTALFEDIALYTKAINFTESAIVITLTRGDGLGSAGNESLVITIPEIVYEKKAPVISGPKGILVEMPFTAFYDNAAETTSMQMVLKNTVAAL